MRLTNKIRDKIILSVVEKKIKPRAMELQDQLIDIVNDAAKTLYEDDIKLWFDRSPEGGCHTKSSFSVILDGDKYPISNNMLDLRKRFSTQFFPLRKNVKVIALDYSKDYIKLNHSDSVEFKSILRKLDNLSAKKELTISTVTSALYACTTKDRLEKEYPELVKYLPKIEAVQKSLTVTRSDVKKLV